MSDTSIRRARVRRRLSQVALARAAGVSQQVVSKYEQGSEPSLRHAWAIAGALRLPLGKLWPELRGPERANTARAGYE